MSNLLIVFAKAPEPGKVKTRLIPELTEQQAANLQKAFIYDILMHTRVLCQNDKITRMIACTPGDHPFFESLKEQENIHLIRQKGADLGERMKNATQKGQGQGYKKIVIIGCDSPTLPVQYIEDAFSSLSTMEVVLGPGLDGGYYLIGLRTLLPQLFTDIPWGTSTVLAKTLDKINKNGVKTRMLPFWYDIDRPNDLDLLRSHLTFLRQQNPDFANATAAFLLNSLSEKS